MRPSLRALGALTLLGLGLGPVRAALEQGQELDYLAAFGAIDAAQYSVARDSPGALPEGLLSTCANKGWSPQPSQTTTLQPNADGVVDSPSAAAQCPPGAVCVVPPGTTLRITSSLNLGALIVRGAVEWSDATQVQEKAYLCAGYVAVEGNGRWDMHLDGKEGVVYIKDNGWEHPGLRSRAFGSYASAQSDYPIIDIEGREMARTWSLLAAPLAPGDDRIVLMHRADLMGWRVGDRIGVSPTERLGEGVGEEFAITAIDKGAITLNRPVQYDHQATFAAPTGPLQSPALMSAEVVNLSRNVLITGDAFRHVPCDPSLPEAIPGEGTSVAGCRCASFRRTCTVGLHTISMNAGEARIQNVRVERCGQRGIEGKYCLHFHKLHDCPTCLFRNNAIEGGHQRGIIVHGTHSSVVESNVLWNVRGAGIYIEDGNEMYNDLKYNVIVCPNKFLDTTLHGCTVPGTSSRIADTSDNHSGIFSKSATNNLIGNRAANAFNGMFYQAEGGRGASFGRVCASDAEMGRIEGNTWHGNGRFGTYTLGNNYPKITDRTILTDGNNVDMTTCDGFDAAGNGRGAPASMVNNVDYNNNFIGHYNAGDIQHVAHHSYSNLNLMYWKETKDFENGCSSHLVGGSYASGNVALPDQATFIMEDMTFGDAVELEANHHCDEGTTGVLCFPQYVLHGVRWKNAAGRWARFQSNTPSNFGGVFALSPPDADVVMAGGSLEDSFFPPGYVSLVSAHFTYLLDLPGSPCILSSTSYGNRYDGGILCAVPLRALKVYSRDLHPGGAPALIVEVWYDKDGRESGAADASQSIPFHDIGGTPKQGYSLPVVPGAEHFYRLSLSGGMSIPWSWVVEFSSPVIGNRWSIEYINLALNGRLCGSEGLISSHHNRRFMWSGDEFMNDQAWGNTGACGPQSQDSPQVNCSAMEHVLPPAECPELCSGGCGSNSYCACGTAVCKLRAGFAGSADMCAAARCGDHGTCSATYLGGELPVTGGPACVCDVGWSGPTCELNPCEAQGKSCGDNGICVALSDDDVYCKCDPGYSGDSCQTSCDAVCSGSYPYNCNPNLGDDIAKYGCSSSGGCDYLGPGGQFGPGWCTFKEVVASGCLCGNDNDCELMVLCNGDGSCPAPRYLADQTPCHSVPYGVCVGGQCVEEGTTGAPNSPTKSSPTLNTKSPAKTVQVKNHSVSLFLTNIAFFLQAISMLLPGQFG